MKYENPLTLDGRYAGNFEGVYVGESYYFHHVRDVDDPVIPKGAPFELGDYVQENRTTGERTVLPAAYVEKHYWRLVEYGFKNLTRATITKLHSSEDGYRLAKNLGGQ